MNEIGVEYGEALFKLAKEEGLEERIFLDLQHVVSVFYDEPEYVELLASRNISAREKEEALDQAFGGVLHDYVLTAVKLMAAKGQIRHFTSCVNEYNGLYQQDSRVITAKVTSVVPLSDEERERLEAKLEEKTGRAVKCIYSTDESLIGGVVVEYDGNIIDGSLKRRLQDIKDVMGK